jgi:hypothetical protein
MITRTSEFYGFGSQNAALKTGGTDASECTEEYNGSSWSAGGATINGRNAHAMAGTQNAGLAFGGESAQCNTEEYNGSTWSVGGNMNFGRRSLAGFGSQNAAIAHGGYNGPAAGYQTEAYNGTTWSNTVDSIKPSTQFYAAGTRTAGLTARGGCVQEFTSTPGFVNYQCSIRCLTGTQTAL